MAHDPNIDPLASLRGGSSPFTLGSSLERAALRQQRSRVVRRTLFVGFILITVTAVCLWFALGIPSTPVATAVNLAAPPPPATPVPSPTISSVPAVRLDRPLPYSTRSVFVPQPLLINAALATPEILRSLDVDLAAYKDIRSMLGSSDRVVMVDNTANRETCIQITCEGGDARSIVCSAPAPSPFRVTNLDGGLIFDIERSNGSLASGPYLPMRTRIGDEEVLLWYENIPDVMAKLGRTQIQPLVVEAHRTVLRRPDKSVVFTRPGRAASWSSVAVYTISGTEIGNVRIVWHSTEANELEVSISDIPLGVYELRTTTPDNEVERMLIVVR
ncbi:MAG: hypothetical protein IPP80_13120 [Ignavibacteria bacterium]|nr:hypothetical protein [Ignavibacteria bacterium]